MANEIEKKYRLTAEDTARIAEDLDELGAEYQGAVSEENFIYSGPMLIEKNAVIRIRITEAGARLTFKQWVPREGDLKEHIEHETSIDDPAAAAGILRSLGFSVRLVYEKRRRTWKLRDAEVVLDELPFGLFMEIEGEPAAIREVEMILEAESLPPEPETYPRLTERLGVVAGEAKEARFPKEKTL